MAQLTKEVSIPLKKRPLNLLRHLFLKQDSFE